MPQFHVDVATAPKTPPVMLGPLTNPHVMFHHFLILFTYHAYITNHDLGARDGSCDKVYRRQQPGLQLSHQNRGSRAPNKNSRSKPVMENAPPCKLIADPKARPSAIKTGAGALAKGSEREAGQRYCHKNTKGAFHGQLR